LIKLQLFAGIFYNSSNSVSCAVYLQEAQLWQRDRAKLDTFSINVQRYSQKWNFAPPYKSIRSNVCALSKIFNKKKPSSRVSLKNVSFTRKTAN